MRAKPILFGLLIAAMIAGGLYYFLREEPLEDTKRESVVTRMAFSGSHLTEMQDGKQIWDLTARMMEVDSKTQWVYLTDMTGVIYRQDGTKIDVTGKQAVVDPKTRNVEITDGITMTASDGPTFQAQKGRYVAKDRRIFASGSIRATKDDYVLTANELETDDQFEMITVKGNARIVKGGSTP
ncbi:MAG: LPS export ABC transporter periplasmic protein LptC [Veillonellaceae bacterium]|nr:LPS export ABC transporter periplasmic protein LptC [Veillonellaceae bacterium]